PHLLLLPETKASTLSALEGVLLTFAAGGSDYSDAFLYHSITSEIYFFVYETSTCKHSMPPSHIQVVVGIPDADTNMGCFPATATMSNENHPALPIFSSRLT
ncbi:MAG: hypothetical protein ACLVK0_13765, partial [Parabacteroides merdae]